MSETDRIRVLLADHHQLLRDGLQEVLEGAGQFEVVGQAGNGHEALEAALRLRPGVVAMDAELPVRNGIDTCRDIKESLPETNILILAGSADGELALESVMAGAIGFLPKYSSKERFLDTVGDVSRGEYRIPGELIRKLVGGFGSRVRNGSALGTVKLNQRQREILTLFAQGMSYTQIADVRGKRPLTIRNSIYGIQRKLQVGSKQEMVVWAVRNGLLDDEPLYEGR